MWVCCIVFDIDSIDVMFEFCMNLLNIFFSFHISSRFMLFPTCLESIENCPFTYWLKGRWFLQIVDREFEHGVKWKVVSPDTPVGIYILYILHSLVLIFEPKGGGSI